MILLLGGEGNVLSLRYGFQRNHAEDLSGQAAGPAPVISVEMEENIDAYLREDSAEGCAERQRIRSERRGLLMMGQKTVPRNRPTALIHECEPSGHQGAPFIRERTRSGRLIQQ